MVFAQITYRQSLRDIEACLRAMQSKLYHCGIHGTVSRNTLANANEHRDWRIYADFAQVLISKAQKLYANEDFGIRLNREVYALDSTTIDLCLTLFPWAKFRKHKAAVKLHTLMSLKGSIPTFIRITDGKVHDVNILEIHLPNEQLFTGGTDNRSTLQVPLADRNLFQMDQAVPSYQDIFRHQCQRCENSNLDSYQRLRSGGDCQERTQNRTEFGRNLANSQHCTFRESLYYTSTYENYVAKRKYPVS
jgi:hypothetical protein